MGEKLIKFCCNFINYPNNTARAFQRSIFSLISSLNLCSTQVSSDFKLFLNRWRSARQLRLQWTPHSIETSSKQPIALQCPYMGAATAFNSFQVMVLSSDECFSCIRCDGGACTIRVNLLPCIQWRCIDQVFQNTTPGWSRSLARFVQLQQVPTYSYCNIKIDIIILIISIF